MRKQWLDHTVYKVYRDEQSRCWEAAILTPSSNKAEIFKPFEETAIDTVSAVRQKYAPCVRLTDYFFQMELEKRTTHTPEMLALLRDNWTGEDLSDWYVYASILRPMSGISIADTHYLPGNSATYQQWTIHTYVVAFEELSAHTIEQYDLVFISRPERHEEEDL